MGCIDCEVAAAVVGGKEGGIWRSADYAEQKQQLAEKVQNLQQSQRSGGAEGEQITDSWSRGRGTWGKYRTEPGRRSCCGAGC